MATRLWRALALGFAAALATLALAGGALGAGETSIDWRVSFDSNIDFNANIFAAFNTPPYFIFTEVYDQLLNPAIGSGIPDPDNSPAESWEISPDGTVYTFHLKPNLKWADGVAMTAEDVAWSWNNTQYSNVNSGYVTYLKKAVAVDPLTARITLTQPDARILSAYVPILPKHIWGKIPKDDLTKFNPCCPMIGSGPFIVTKLDRKGTSILEPNPYFYGPKGSIQRILMTKYQDKEAQLRDIKLNRLDAILQADSEWIKSVDDPELTVWGAAYVGFKELAFNSCPPEGSPTCTGPGPDVAVAVVQDPAIRLALAWGIDRDNLARTAYADAVLPGTGIISPFYAGKGYYTSWKGTSVGYTFDPAKAKKILADGGWTCPAGGTCEKDGVKAEFTLIARSSSREDQNAANRIRAWANELGIKINLSIITDDALNSQIYNPTSSTKKADADKYEPTYDAFIWGWFGDLGTPDYDFEILTCGSFSTDSYYCNPEFDKLSQEALAETDFDRRVDLLHQAEKIALEESPYVFLTFQNSPYVTRNDTWTNYQPTPKVDGNPFSISWSQLQFLEPGKKASTSYAGAPAALIVLLVGIAAVFAYAWLRRWREARQPLEVSEQSEGKP